MGPLAAAGIAAGVGAGIDTIANVGMTAWNQAYNSNEAQKQRNWEAEQAILAREFQSGQNELTRQFNSAEAQKSRDWQERMSNSAYQRSISDMEKAGVNPALLATGVSAASTPSGFSAQSMGSTSSGIPSGSSAHSSAISSVNYFSEIGKLVLNSALKTSIHDKDFQNELVKEERKHYQKMAREENRIDYERERLSKRYWQSFKTNIGDKYYK